MRMEHSSYCKYCLSSEQYLFYINKQYVGTCIPINYSNSGILNHWVPDNAIVFYS